jgi:hypothetical protein
MGSPIPAKIFLVIFFLWTAGMKKTCLSRHLGFFEKHFFYKICVLLTPNECKKKIEKMLDALRVM